MNCTALSLTKESVVIDVWVQIVHSHDAISHVAETERTDELQQRKATLPTQSFR